MPACQAQLPDGRLHFQHGPIDIVIGADGDASAIRAAHAAAWRRFEGVLDELVAELPALRLRVNDACTLNGPVARRMWFACHPYREAYITPMAAVAGAVAQELIAYYEVDGIERAWVNDGGDIAWHLTPHRSLRVGLFADLSRLDAKQIMHGIRSDGHIDVGYELPVRGVATSGWRGRSLSRGIADSVTVLARTSAEADAAATVIANAVDVIDPRIVRKPACEVKDDSDLGEIAVTVEVPPLGDDVTQRALAAGARCATTLRDAGLIWSCTLVCQGRVTYVSETQLERSVDENPATVHAIALA